MNMGDEETLTVEVPVVWLDGLCLPVSQSDIVETATFKRWTFRDNLLVEKFCWQEDEIKSGNRSHKYRSIDYVEMRRMSLKRCLLDWSLSVPIERDNDWITDDSYKRIGQVYAPLLEAFVVGFWNQVEISMKEREEIEKQATILFSPTSRGVAHPCEAIRLYCTLGGFADKFNMNMDDILDLPFREYSMLKMMLSYDNESVRRQQSKGKDAPIKVAGPGGTRPSRGKKVRM